MCPKKIFLTLENGDSGAVNARNIDAPNDAIIIELLNCVLKYPSAPAVKKIAHNGSMKCLYFRNKFGPMDYTDFTHTTGRYCK